MPATYIALDTETGGIGPEVNLLTAWFGVYDEKLTLLDSLDLKIKPKNKLYVVTANGLDVNKINLVEHDKVAIEEKEAATKLYDFIYFWSGKGAVKMIPVGHNVKFDVVKVCEVLVSPLSWEKFVSYRSLDTGVIAQFLKVLGLIPESVPGSLGSIISHFQIATNGSLHTAEVDAKMTVEVLKAMLSEIRSKIASTQTAYKTSE